MNQANYFYCLKQKLWISIIQVVFCKALRSFEPYTNQVTTNWMDIFAAAYLDDSLIYSGNRMQWFDPLSFLYRSNWGEADLRFQQMQIHLTTSIISGVNSELLTVQGFSWPNPIIGSTGHTLGFTATSDTNNLTMGHYWGMSNNKPPFYDMCKQLKRCNWYPAEL